MKNRNPRVVIIIFLLLVSLSTWSRISSGIFSIRAVDFLSILAIGMLTGVLIASFAFPGKKNNKT